MMKSYRRANRSTWSKTYSIATVSDKNPIRTGLESNQGLRAGWTDTFNLLKPTGYGMYQQVEYFNNCTLCPYCIYVFCICLRTNSNLRHLHKKLIDFYKQDEKCLLRGTNWAFKWGSLRFVC
jgi:hypothetical protein